MSKYSELKTSDVISTKFISKSITNKEFQIYKKISGVDISMDDHPLVVVGNYFRHIYLTINNAFTIESFKNKYLPIFKEYHSKHVLDILNIYSRMGSQPNNEQVKSIKEGLDIVNGILSKIGGNITAKAFDTYTKSYDDKDFNLNTHVDAGGLGISQNKSILEFMWMLHRKSKHKANNFNGYPFSLMNIMFTTEGYPIKYMDGFLGINGYSDMSSILNVLNAVNPNFSLGNFTRHVDMTMGDLRKQFQFYSSMEAFLDDDVTEAVGNFAMGLQTLFYIKAYLDYTYQTFGNASHKRTSLSFSSGVNKEKAKQEAAKIKVPATKMKTTKFRGIFGEDTGTKPLSKGRGSSQEVANMQITIAALVSDLIPHYKIDNMVEDEDPRFIDSIEEIKNIDTSKVEIGKTFKLDSKLNDGIFGFRTKKLVELYQSYVKDSTKIPDTIKKDIAINGVYDTPTRKSVEHLISNEFNKIPTISKSEIVSPTIDLLSKKPKKDDLADVRGLLGKNSDLAKALQEQPKQAQKEAINLLSRAGKGLDDESKIKILANIIGFDLRQSSGEIPQKVLKLA